MWLTQLDNAEAKRVDDIVEKLAHHGDRFEKMLKAVRSVAFVARYPQTHHRSQCYMHEPQRPPPFLSPLKVYSEFGKDGAVLEPLCARLLRRM
jgi:hypothetical protein